MKLKFNKKKLTKPNLCPYDDVKINGDQIITKSLEKKSLKFKIKSKKKIYM